MDTAVTIDSLGRMPLYIRIHYDEIIIRGKSTADPFPTNPVIGDIWYDIATDKTWIYTSDLNWTEVPF